MDKIKSWLEMNSIKLNELYIKTLLNKFGFKIGKNCQIISDAYGDYGVCLSYQGKSYRIEVDVESRSYKLFGKNLVSGVKEKHRYRFIESFSGENIISEILKYIKNRNGRKYNLVS
jgi:hypothetical protein